MMYVCRQREERESNQTIFFTSSHSVRSVTSFSDLFNRHPSETSSFETAANCMRQLLAPYLPATSADSECPIVSSPAGLPSCNLTDSLTVFWLPMDARIGPDDLPQLFRRRCTPRLAVCLPAEVAMKAVSDCPADFHQPFLKSPVQHRTVYICLQFYWI